MQLPHLLLLAGVLGATAHPSGHAHLHRHHHEKRDAAPTPKQFFKNIHKPIPIPEPTPEPKKPEPKPTIAAAPAPSPAKGPSDKGKPKYKPFCGNNKSKRVTYEQVMYTGNLGDHDGCEWNSNMMLVDLDVVDMYDYVAFYKNVRDEPYQVICANKMGADHELTGMFKTESHKQLIFMLQPGETKAVAADYNTQAVCAFAPNEVPLTPFGQYAGNWAEVDFENTSNKGWSGADCSALVAMHYDMFVPGCRICGYGTCSTIWEGGKADNAYIKGMEAEDGVGLNIKPGRVRLDIEVGFI